MLAFTRVRMAPFGRFNDAEFRFGPGFNLICGANEAGKSTLLAAIAGTLFGFRKEREKYLPWQGSGACQAEVAFSYGDREMTVTRDFRTDRVQAVERSGEQLLWQFEGKVAPAGRSSEREEYLRKIEEIWGFSEGDIFRNSVCVGQNDLPIEGGGALGVRLKQLLSGYSELDYDAVLASLERDLNEITRPAGGRARDRELEEVRARLAELTERGREAQGAAEGARTVAAEAGELRAALAQGRADLEKGRRYLERVRAYHGLAERQRLLRGEFERVRADRERIDGLLAREGELERELAESGLLADLPADFPARFRVWQESRERIAALEAEALPLAEAPPPRPGRLWLAALLTSGAAWLALFALLAYQPGLGSPLAGGAMLLTLLLTAGLLMLAVRRTQAQRLTTARSAGRLEGLRAEIAALRPETERFAAEYGDHLALLEGVVLPELDRRLARLREVREELTGIESALRVLPETESLQARGSELARELAIIQERLEGVGGEILPPDEIPLAEEKMRRREQELLDQERRLLQREQELERFSRAVQDREALEEELEYLRGREAQLARRAAALRLALGTLRETLEEYRSTYLERFAREVGERLPLLTGSAYREAVVDGDFQLQLVVDGALRPLESFSCGVQDQACLAVRLALGGILSAGRRLPFLLDDPLVQCDDERRSGALKALDRLAESHQVLLFVHDERYLRLKAAERWQVIRLAARKDDHGQLSLL